MKRRWWCWRRRTGAGTSMTFLTKWSRWRRMWSYSRITWWPSRGRNMILRRQRREGRSRWRAVKSRWRVARFMIRDAWRWGGYDVSGSQWSCFQKNWIVLNIIVAGVYHTMRGVNARFFLLLLLSLLLATDIQSIVHLCGCPSWWWWRCWEWRLSLQMTVILPNGLKGFPVDSKEGTWFSGCDRHTVGVVCTWRETEAASNSKRTESNGVL